eukprot:TRINITY_DN44075_c0_g1_i1.p1 TRINITY_DN44075_c0_g1~~TRINITY_DN44075_c0_g1_i1.p1  ORF type:complete len:302 (+),score=77.37 TRINITY_DN44075_c0_g1_i1:153-1058(+)
MMEDAELSALQAEYEDKVRQAAARRRSIDELKQRRAASRRCMGGGAGSAGVEEAAAGEVRRRSPSPGGVMPDVDILASPLLDQCMGSALRDDRSCGSTSRIGSSSSSSGSPSRRSPASGCTRCCDSRLAADDLRAASSCVSPEPSWLPPGAAVVTVEEREELERLAEEMRQTLRRYLAREPGEREEAWSCLEGSGLGQESGPASCETPEAVAGRRQPYLDAFLCPITQEVMEDPVLCVDGHSYERAAIDKWLRQHQRSPQTGLRLVSKCLVPNVALKKAITEFRQLSLHIGCSKRAFCVKE